MVLAGVVRAGHGGRLPAAQKGDGGDAAGGGGGKIRQIPQVRERLNE